MERLHLSDFYIIYSYILHTVIMKYFTLRPDTVTHTLALFLHFCISTSFSPGAVEGRGGGGEGGQQGPLQKGLRK